MHTATLYRHDEEGHPDLDTPLARITVDDDACVQIRMVRDDSLLYSDTLQQLGYMLLWYGYPVTQPGGLRLHGRT